jgi:hypothetical protein
MAVIFIKYIYAYLPIKIALYIYAVSLLVCKTCNPISTGGGAVLLGADSTILDDNATQVIVSNCTYTDNISR